MMINNTARKLVLACAIALVAAAPTSVLASNHGDNTTSNLGTGLSDSASPRTDAQQSAGKGPSDAETREYFTDLELVDQDGNTLQFYTDVLQGKTVLINFIYTTCQDACPLQTAKMVQVKNAVPDRFGKDVFFVSISVDPLNDTPEALKEFAVQKQADHPGWRFLTGKPANVFHIIKKLGQYTEDRDMHATGMILGNVKTRHWVMINPIIPNVGLSLQLEQFADEG